MQLGSRIYREESSSISYLINTCWFDFSFICNILVILFLDGPYFLSEERDYKRENFDYLGAERRGY